MTVGGGFRRLTRVIRRLERDGWSVEDVSAGMGESLCTVNAVSAIVECRKPSEAMSEHRNGERTLSLTEVESGSGAADIKTREIRPEPNGDIKAVVSVRVPLPGSDSERAQKTETSRPPLHRDTDRLRSLYRRHSSFAEIAEAVEEDVSAETIRRYTIEHGIHSPGEASPRDASPPESDVKPHVLADGHGLPHGIELDVLVSTVERANTLYDVQRELGLGRQEATELLSRFDLLEFVVGRIGTAPDREVARETIEQRLRQAPQ